MLLTACEKDVKIASKMLVTHPMKSTTMKAQHSISIEISVARTIKLLLSPLSLHASITPDYSILTLGSSL